MMKYSFEKLLGIINKKAKINGELKYEIYSQENHYKLKLYDSVVLGQTIVQIPICTFAVNKKTFKIESSEHGYILVTKWNKRILTGIGSVTCSTIEDFEEYIPKEIEVNEKGITESLGYIK